ncbi:uncharacterized protein LOC143469855 isoform X2 [Clavelina lepadiformis]|uniref:uncharacterized protein LOC143469855 isoform X2 n=1 Tax=Clavelina lepadiformis TaxID=159417 RepID=UPI0040437D9C
MLRRKPSSVKLQVEDFSEYQEYCEEQKNKSKRNQDNSNKKSANDTFTILGTRANTKSRLAEIQRRIGIEPNPVTPETSSQYQNIH